MVPIEGKKISPTKKIIDNLEIQIIYAPLESKLGYIYKPTVKPGDYVKVGDIIGKTTVADIPLVATVSGYVVGFDEKYISSGKKVKCIVIENDFKEKCLTKVGKKQNISKLSKEEFIYLLKSCAVTGMGGSDFPTYIKYETDKKIKYLIVNGVECEPYVSSDAATLYLKTEEILESIDAVLDIMDIDEAYIAISEDNTSTIKHLLKHINSYPNIKIFPIMNAYPSGYERYLISEILGLTYDKLPNEVGVICDNVNTMYEIYEALKFNKPLTERIVSITGPGIKNPSNYLVKIGTNFNEIAMKVDLYKNIKNLSLMVGGIMMSSSMPCDDVIITKDVTGIIVLNGNEEKELPCIKCGKCSEVCPMNLIPSLIVSNPKQATYLKINKCINCGLCTYVCPSKIEVREKIKAIKEGLK